MDILPRINNRQLRIPPIGWFLVVCLIAALIAIFIFNIPAKMTAKYSILILIFGAKLFMHARHSGHQHGTTSDASQSDITEPSLPIGGCH
jgi:hypothetical protein